MSDVSSPPVLSISRRTRRTPFTRRVTEQGVKGYTVYNHMLLPTFFRSVADDYWHLREAVQIWDVSCERQVEVRGPEAARLVQLVTPRNIAKMPVGKCYYVPTVDETGGMLNDPVAIKLAEDRYWISVADSDLLFWLKGLAVGMRLDVTVEEPDVSPLAIQGPKSDDVVAAVFGDKARDIGFFRFEKLPFQGRELAVSRTGYSKQGGFEIYLDDFSMGEALWDALWQAGEPHDIRPGGPNLIERIEGGLLSYGNDMTIENTPHECGLGKFCKDAATVGCIGRDVLMRLDVDGPEKQIRGVLMQGPPVTPPIEPWAVRVNGTQVGQITSAVWSPRLEAHAAIGMIDKAHWNAGTAVTVETNAGPRDGEVTDLPFPGAVGG